MKGILTRMYISIPDLQLSVLDDLRPQFDREELRPVVSSYWLLRFLRQDEEDKHVLTSTSSSHR